MKRSRLSFSGIVEEREALSEERQHLEAEAQNLDKRRTALLSETGVSEHRTGSSAYRAHLAELCERLTGAELCWQQAQLEAIKREKSIALVDIDPRAKVTSIWRRMRSD